LTLFLEGNQVENMPAFNNVDEFYIEKGVLFRLPKRKKKNDNSRINNQLVVPKSLLQHVLKLCHDSFPAIHTGYLRTLENARKNFFWLNMATDIKLYVNSCHECQLRRFQGQSRAPLGDFPPIEKPLDRVGVDLIELTLSYNNNKFALVVIDHFSRYVQAYPLPNKSAEEVTKAMVQYVCTNTCPKVIVSDRGSEFISSLFQEVCKRLEMKLNMTTSFHPMGNGSTERVNQTLKKALSHLAAHDTRTWDDQLPYVILATNCAYHTSIKEIPFYIYHGRDPSIPFSDFLGKQKIDYTLGENYAAEMSSRLHKAFEIVKNNSSTAHQVSAEYYNKNTKESDLKVGTMVFLSNETNLEANRYTWRTKWIGPYRIIDKFNNNFRIQGIYADRKKQTLHANRLKLANMREGYVYPFIGHPVQQPEVNHADNDAQTRPYNLRNRPN
jgi:transposase InsO family protein